MMDNVFRWNIQGVLRSMHEAEVLNVTFPCLAQTLIVDFRHDEVEGPAVAIQALDDVNESPRAKIRSLERLRPRFPTPENLTVVPWRGAVRSLAATGALADLDRRLEHLGFAAARAELERVYQKLLLLERQEVGALIRGDLDRTRSLWQR